MSSRGRGFIATSFSSVFIHLAKACLGLEFLSSLLKTESVNGQ